MTTDSLLSYNRRLRGKILVFHWCYHGSVDETFITLEDGVAKPRRRTVHKGPAELYY